MAYVAVSGGREAIEASIRLLQYYRGGSSDELGLESMEEKMSLVIDRVMGEAGLYSKHYAALALKQCEGCIEEAVFLLRAYRSTLTRKYYSEVMDTCGMRLIRRISSAFKDIPGGQILGATYDYTHRLLNFNLEHEDAAAIRNSVLQEIDSQNPEEAEACLRVSGEMQKEGLMDANVCDDTEPFDVTANLLEFPAPRSARLQTLARADTGFITGLAYSSLRGFGLVHPTVGELRTGWSEICVPYLFDNTQSIFIGEILLTDAETFTEAGDKNCLKLASGYGAVFGRNENKAIAMAILDRELETKGVYPSQNEEFVLTHGDSLEMNGFISHLKLPHYVTFQSKLDSVRKTRNESDAR